MDANEPIPYYAGLAKVLHGPTLSLVLTYLEFHHPAPQDPSDGLQGLVNEPVVLDCDVAVAALGCSRRTLHIALSCLGTCWGAEEARARAARAGREFINPTHTRFDSTKIYSFTGSKAYTQPERKLVVRRNYPKLLSILTLAGIVQPVCTQTHDSQRDEACASVSALPSLPDILRSVLPNWGDRRADRWERWRRENGKKSNNPGRMRGSKIGVTSSDAGASG